jgi:thiamine biosynthesis protein ThiS
VVPGFLSAGTKPLATINILVNDVPRTVPAETSVETLLRLLGLQPRFLAVELNRRVVPRGEHPLAMLTEGDRVEIVTLVGGG